jgi:hypothetical protein
VAALTLIVAGLWQSIVGGAPTTGDPAVVAIAHREISCGTGPTVVCSGVVVAPRVVLTAAHCMNGPTTRGAFEVIVGSTATAPTKVIVVQSVVLDAAYDMATGDHDLAVLLLAEDAGVSPIAKPTGSVADLAANATLRAVGFGFTGPAANDPGTKRDGTMALGTVSSARFDATPSPAMTCTADSGGPVFATIAASEQLVGITSRGDGGCAVNAVNARVDVAQSSLVDPQISAAAYAPAGWPSSIPFAVPACSVDDECPALMTCNDQHHCAFSWLGDGTFGSTCTTDAECGSARCARVWPSGGDACHCFAEANPPGGDGTSEPPEGCCSSGGDASGVLLALIALARTTKRKLFHARDQRRA